VTRVIDVIGAVIGSADAPTDQKLEALHVLSLTRHPSAVTAVRVAMKDSDPTVRLGAAVALLNANDAGALREIEETLNRPGRLPIDLVRNLQAALSVGIRDPAAVPSLTRLLRAESVETRRAAVQALMNTRSASAIEPLRVALDDADFSVRYEAIRALARMTEQPDRLPSRESFRANEELFIRYWKDWQPPVQK
jgi:HEAT repeat protein